MVINVETFFFKHIVHKVYNFTISAIEADNYVPSLAHLTPYLILMAHLRQEPRFVMI